MFALIAGMLCNRSLRPGFGTLRRIVLRRITNEVNRELTPYDQLVEVAVARSPELRIGLHRGFDGQRNSNWSDMPKVEVGRHTRSAIQLRVIPLRVVNFEKLPRKDFQPLQRSMCSARPRLHRSDAAIKGLRVPR